VTAVAERSEDNEELREALFSWLLKQPWIRGGLHEADVTDIIRLVAQYITPGRKSSVHNGLAPAEILLREFLEKWSPGVMDHPDPGGLGFVRRVARYFIRRLPTKVVTG